MLSKTMISTAFRRHVNHVHIQNRLLSSTSSDEIKMLEKLLRDAKSRQDTVPTLNDGKGGATGESEVKFNIGTFNAISPSGLKKFSSKRYIAVPMQSEEAVKEEIHAILLRSFKLGSSDVPDTVRAIARCGSGTNNIDVEAMSERGIPVFNTPGANANAVKELAICGILLSSRGIVDGIQHVHKIVDEDKPDWGKVKKRVETDKKMFVGKEIAGKKLGVVGLGHIGASVAQTCIAMGMNVMGYDPAISVEGAWRLPGDVMERAQSLQELCEECDYISLHVPYMKETHHLINEEMLKSMKPGCHIVNFARGELVDTQAMLGLYNSGERTGRYICDFADEFLHDNPKTVCIPHLGASTAEAEENAASMAAIEIQDFIESGTIVNSVNFPTTKLDKVSDSTRRICIVNKNVPGMLGLIATTLGRSGANIIQQINTSHKNIAYNVVDIDGQISEEKISEIQSELSKLEGIISSRMISSDKFEPGFFHVNNKN